MIAVFRSLALGLILLMLLWGCASTPESATAITTKDESAAYSSKFAPIPNNWTVTGRISIINEQENWYAKFTWIQQADDFQISFTGPLGETELQISRIAGKVTLKLPAEEYSGTDLEQLIYQQTGWILPLSSLYYWIQGFPDPQSNAQLAYNEEQQSSEMTQAGWRIQYPRRIAIAQPENALILLPKKIIASKEDMKIKLIVTRWYLGEQSFGLLNGLE